MGDRCYMELRCRKEHAPVFEDMGFVVQEENCEGAPDLVKMIQEEANYAHYGEMPTNIPYVGWHGGGGEYGAEIFACDGREYSDANLDVQSGDMVVHLDKLGKPSRYELGFIRKFLAIDRRARKALGLVERKRKPGRARAKAGR